MGYDPQSGMGGGNIDIHTILTSLAKKRADEEATFSKITTTVEFKLCSRMF